jgi:alpha-ribazole phosphatase
VGVIREKGAHLARLLLVRHGETEANSSERFWGKTDVRLGPVGLRQAEKLRDRLASEKIDYVYASQMKRALVTAQTIAAPHQVEVTSCPELREIDFGKIEGLKFNEVDTQFPEVTQLWLQRSPQLAYPGGESLVELDARITEFRTRLVKHTEKELVLIVAHSGVLRTLICQVLDLEMRNRWNIRLDLASLSIIDTYPETAILSLLNDTSHLIDK